MATTSGDQKDEAREQRVQALRELSDSSAPGASSEEGRAPSAGPSVIQSPAVRARRLPRPLVIAGLVVVVAAVVIAGFATFHRGAPTGKPTAARPLSFSPAVDGLTCTRDAAWSPSGSQVAFVGYAPTVGAPGCPPGYSVSSQERSGIISLYQARTGRLLSQFHPDTAIRSHLTVPPAVLNAITAAVNPAEGTPTAYTIDYTHVLWAPDSSHLYVTWLAMVPTGLPDLSGNAPPVWPSFYATGVVAIGVSAGTVSAMSTTLGADPYHAVGWDLTTNQVNPAFQRPASQTRFATLQPAQVYQWNADGSLTPAQPLPTVGNAAVPTQPTTLAIGSPQGGATFSMWQPGTLELHINSDTTGVTLAGNPLFATDIAAISPNGRYLVEGVSLQTITVTNSDNVRQAQALAAQGLSALPLAPARDRAFAALQSLSLDKMIMSYTLSRSLVSVPTYGEYLAWSPNGRYLAAIYSQPRPTTVIYDCQTGAVVATLTEQTGAPSPDDSAPKLLRWSPDGSRLLALDPSAGAVTLWGPGQLPSA